MRNDVVKIISGIGVLIAIFLFLNNGDQTRSIIQTIASNSIQGFRVLQGR